MKNKLSKKLIEQLNKMLPDNLQVAEESNNILRAGLNNARYHLFFDVEEKEPKLKKGEWLFLNWMGCDIYVINPKEGVLSVGFLNGNWQELNVLLERKDYKYKKADPDKVKSLLIEKAKNDYPVGIKVKCLYDEETEIIDNHEIKLEFSENELWLGPNILVFRGGKWAEKVEPVKEKPLMLGDEVVEIKRGIKGRFIYKKDTIHCKCESVTKDEWLELHKKLDAIKSNEINYCSLYWSGYEVDVELSDKYFNISIGCIMNITIEQIEAITKKLKEL